METRALRPLCSHGEGARWSCRGLRSAERRPHPWDRQLVSHSYHSEAPCCRLQALLAWVQSHAMPALVCVQCVWYLHVDTGSGQL